MVWASDPDACLIPPEEGDIRYSSGNCEGTVGQNWTYVCCIITIDGVKVVDRAFRSEK